MISECLRYIHVVSRTIGRVTSSSHVFSRKEEEVFIGVEHTTTHDHSTCGPTPCPSPSTLTRTRKHPDTRRTWNPYTVVLLPSDSKPQDPS